MTIFGLDVGVKDIVVVPANRGGKTAAMKAALHHKDVTGEMPLVFDDDFVKRVAATFSENSLQAYQKQILAGFAELAGPKTPTANFVLHDEQASALTIDTILQAKALLDKNMGVPKSFISTEDHSFDALKYGMVSAPPPMPKPTQQIDRHLHCVTFICRACHRPVAGFTCYGRPNDVFGLKGFRYLVRCHNSTAEVIVEEIPASATPAQPHVIDVFNHELKAAAAVKSGAPNVMFHCSIDNTICHEFGYQKDTGQSKGFVDTHVFIVTCRGPKCQGKQHRVRYHGKDLHDRDAWKTVVPLLLPINTTLLGKAAPKPPTPVNEINQPTLRKLRLEE